MLMMFSASFLLMGIGFFCIKDTELAWQLYEWDCRMMNMAPLRLANWRLRVKQVGYVLIGLGIVGLKLGMGL
jgi:hypothetical protein